jgi:lysophospholipase L1-like esterase
MDVLSLRIAATVLAGCVCVGTRAESLPPMRVILVGDSTMQANTGYGEALCARFRPEVTCINVARGGRSTKTFRAEALWADVMATLSAKAAFSATYVLIQFGHNDQPGKPERSTTLPQFEANLAAYVDDVRSAGAVPVLVTPLTRRQFADGKLIPGLEPWAEVTRRLAAAKRVDVLDLHRDSVRAVQALGPTRANELAQAPPSTDLATAAVSGTTVEVPLPPPWTGAGPKPPSFDYTHLGPEGARVFSAIVAQEIRSGLPDLRRYVIDDELAR